MKHRGRALAVVSAMALFATTDIPAVAQEDDAPQASEPATEAADPTAAQEDDAPQASEPATEAADPTATVIEASRHDTSAPLRDMVRPLDEALREGEPRVMPLLLPDEILERATRRAQPITEDPLRQLTPGQAATPDPLVNFEGQSDDDNAATPGAFRLVPPDTEGDVGPNHYVQMINVITEIYDKEGNSLLGPFANIDLFSGFGGPCETENDGDPVALYDQLADRWMLSQFAIEQGIQCVAVSTSGDPTGTYHRYEFPVSVSPNVNDYPKMGVWPDGYYLTFNEFDDLVPPAVFLGAVACAFERDQMLDGNPAQQVCFRNPPSGGDTFFSLQPAHLEGLTTPPEGTPNPFIMAFDDEVWGGSPDPSRDFYKMWQFSVDWDDPTGSSTFTGPIDVPTEEFDAEFCNFSRNCIGQPATTSNLDVLGQFTMYRAVYRSFGDEHLDGPHEALWVNHSVDLDGTSHAGIRWTEIRSPATTPVLHQTGTWGPADEENRWMGSLSVDDGGNMLLAYSVSSESTFPSIRYAGRLVRDPLGTLGQKENELWAGTGSQVGSGNRWGDYSTVSLDESDGCSFWFTNEYYETTTSFDFKTRIGAARYLTCLSAEIGTIAGTVTDADVGGPIEDVTVTADDGTGGVFSSVTNDGGSYAISLPAGTYGVTASASGYEPEAVTGVVVTDGATTVVDFSLSEGPTADITPDSFTFEVPLGDTASDTLTIGNVGVADLVWSIAEADSAEECSTPVDIPWLSATPETGTTVPGGSESVAVSVDTSSLEVGRFEAALCVTTNDSDASVVPVTVTLNVTPPASFGALEGTVRSASSCDPTFSEPLAGATVTVTGQLGTHVAETDDAGFYQLSLDEAESPLTIEVTAPGHVPGSAEGVVVTAGQVTVQDFDLILDAPCADVSPDSITTTLEVGQSEDHTLTIGNSGSQTLEWTIRLPEPPPAGSDAAAPDEPGAADSPGAEEPNPDVEPPSPEDEAAGIDRSERTAEPAEPTLTGPERIQQLQEGVLLIPQSVSQRIVALDPETGDVIDENFIDYSDVGSLGTLQHVLLHPDGERLLVSSQTQDVVHSFDLEGNYLGVFAPAGGADTSIMNNIRGMAFHPQTGNLLVTSDAAPAADRVVEFDLDGNHIGQFIAAGAGGISGPWSLVFRGSDALLSDGTGNAIHRFDHDGNHLDVFNDEINFSEQIAEIENGNILGAAFSSPSGVWEFDPDGNLIAIYNPVTALRGVFELPDGNILTTNGGGIHRFSRNEPAETLLSGSSHQISAIGVLECDVPEWLSVNPVSGSTQPGGSDTVTVSIDTTGLPLGQHTAGICVDSNDPVRPTVSVPVTLNVVLPPNFGTIQGTVQSLGYCGADVAALEGATVEVVGTETTETLVTDEDGFYQVHLPDSESPLTITVTAEGHLPVTVEGVTFVGGDVVTQDFDLDLEAACATVDPAEFSFDLREKDVAAETLTIGNVDGAVDLEWSIAEAEPVVGTSAAAPSDDPRAHFPDQTREVEPKTENIPYWAGYQGGGNSQIFTVDTTTGEATSIGNVAGGSELLSFSVALPGATLRCDTPSDIAWLSVDPGAGTAAAGSSSGVEVTIDTTELTAGEYQAGLCVTTSDPFNPLIEVPVALTLRPEFVLEAEGRRVRGLHFVDLTWSGALSEDVDIYRDGELIATERNDGAHTDNTGQSNAATYIYQVCEAGTEDCSNEVTVTFGGPPAGRGGGG